MNKPLALSLIAVLGLVACASEPRQGPPAPVVRVTPREAPPATTPGDAVPADASSEARVYAYQDPSTAAPEAQAGAAVSPSSPGASRTALVALPPPETASRQPPSAAAPEPQNRPTASTAPASTPLAPRSEPARSPSPAGAGLPPPEQSVAMAPAPAAPAVSVAAPSLPPAADALARQAEQQRQSGDYAGAAASLERSLRIAPSEAYLWNRLARVRLEQGQYPLAGNLASRSNGLAPADSGIKRDNWRIIAEARRRAGDAAGASEAERRANGG